MSASHHRSSPRRRRRGRTGPAAGFTLLEVLVAMVMLAVGLSALYPSFGTAVRTIDSAEGHLVARQLALSILDERMASRTFGPGTLSGRDGDYRWSLAVAPADEALSPASGMGHWALYRLVLTVTWPPQRRYQVETLHIGVRQ